MTYKDDLKHFEGPSKENDAHFARMNTKDQEAMTQFVSRANSAFAYVRKNGIPECYQESARVYNEILRQNSAGPINLESLYALDTAVGETIWAADTFSKIGIPTSVMQKPRFEIKEYLVQSEEIPHFTTTFRNPHYLRLKESSQFTNGVGMEMGISIPFTEIHEGNGALWSPQAILMQELAAKFGVYKNRRGWLGTSALNAIGDDGSTTANWGITGLFNYGSVQTFEAGIGADDNIQDQGDLEFSLRTALADLRKVMQPGKIVVVSTSGAASHLFYERDTYTQQLDIERIKSFKKDTQFGLVDEWWVTEDLYAAAPSASNQQLMVMKVSPALMQRHIIYPQQMLPLANKTFEKDIQEVSIFADIIQVKKVDTTYNAVPITIAADLTADGTGFIPEGSRII